MKVPRQIFLNFMFFGSFYPKISYPTGISAGISKQSYWRFWSTVGPSCGNVDHVFLHWGSEVTEPRYFQPFIISNHPYLSVCPPFGQDKEQHTQTTPSTKGMFQGSTKTRKWWRDMQDKMSKAEEEGDRACVRVAKFAPTELNQHTHSLGRVMMPW